MSPSIDKIREFQCNNSSINNSLEEKKKFTVNDIIKDARKDTKLSVSASNQSLGEKKILRKLQL